MSDWLRWLNGWRYFVEVFFAYPLMVPVRLRVGFFHAYDPRWPRKDWMEAAE